MTVDLPLINFATDAAFVFNANCRLKQSGVDTLPLNEEDAFILYLTILTLYQEGVRPTSSEIHFKLKEHRCSPDVITNFAAYYLAQHPLYDVYVDGNFLSPSERTSMQTLLIKSATTSLKQQCKTRLFASAETVVLLHTTPTWFGGWVNVRSPGNVYSAEVWYELLSYFRRCTSKSELFQDEVFKVTRYALAKSLKQTAPPLVRSLRLGEIAHMIQLALQEGLLCYEANTIQPLWMCFSAAATKSYILNVAVRSEDSPASSEFLRGHAEPTSSTSPPIHQKHPSTVEVAISDDQSTIASSSAVQRKEELLTPCTLSELRAALSTLLNEEENQPILLSQLRVLLQNRLGKAVTPGALGHSKLSNLLEEEFSDICKLLRFGGRHVYVEKVTGSPAAKTKITTKSSPVGTIFALTKQLFPLEAGSMVTGFGASSGECLDGALSGGGLVSPFWTTNDVEKIQERLVAQGGPRFSSILNRYWMQRPKSKPSAGEERVLDLCAATFIDNRL